MIIDKTVGNWKNYGTTQIDDYAYQLYLNNKISNCTKHSQLTVMYYYYNNQNRFKSFYKKAHDLIIAEKINKLNEIDL